MTEAQPIDPLEEIDASAGVHKSGPGQETRLTRAEFAKGFAWTSSFSLIAKIVFPLAGIYINRRLGPAVLGLGLTLQMTVQLSEVLREAGLTQTFMNEPEMTEELLGAYTALKFLSSILPALLVICLSPLFVTFFGQPDLGWSIPLIGLCLVMNGLGAVPIAQLLRRGDFRTQGLIAIVAATSGLTVTVILVAMGIGFASLVAQLLVTCTVNLLLTLRAQPLSRFNFDWNLMRSRSRKSRSLLGANVLNNIFLMTDVFVIMKLVGVTASGFYNTAQNIAYRPLDLVLFPLGKTLMVAFGQTRDPIRLSNIYWRAIKAIILLLIPIYVFMACNAEGIVYLLFGKAFYGSIPVLVVLCLYLASRTLGSISGNAMVPIGRQSWTLYPWALALVIVAAGIWINGGHPTLMGIVWSFTAGAMAVYLSIFCLAAYWLKPTKEAVRELANAISVLTISSACMVGFQYWSVSPIIRLLASAPIIAVLHLVITGLVFEKSISAYLSLKGIKNLYHSL